MSESSKPSKKWQVILYSVVSSTFFNWVLKLTKFCTSILFCFFKYGRSPQFKYKPQCLFQGATVVYCVAYKAINCYDIVCIVGCSPATVRE